MPGYFHSIIWEMKTVFLIKHSNTVCSKKVARSNQ